jgi:hypothetical protein
MLLENTEPTVDVGTMLARQQAARERLHPDKFAPRRPAPAATKKNPEETLEPSTDTSISARVAGVDLGELCGPFRLVRERVIGVIPGATLAPPDRVIAKALMRNVCERHSSHRLTVTPQCLLSYARPMGYARARQELYYLLWKSLPHWSLPQIGRFMSRDHTTVIHGIQAFCARNGFGYDRHAATDGITFEARASHAD